MRFFSLFAIAFLSLSSAQSQNVASLNISSAVQNGTIADMPIELKGTNEELSIAKYLTNQTSDQLIRKNDQFNQTNDQLIRKTDQLFQTNDQLNLTENVLSIDKPKAIKSELDKEIELHNQTKYQLEQLKKQLNQTKYQLNKVGQANAERCMGQLAAQNLYKTTTKSKCCRGAADYLQAKPDFTWLVQGANAFLNGSTRELFSDEFDLSGYPFGAQAKLKWYDETRVIFGLSFKDKDGRKGPIDVSVFPRIVCRLKDQSSSIEPNDRFYSYTYFFKSDQMNYDTFYYYQLQRNATDVINTTLYTANDTMVMDVYFEPPEEAELVFSYNGTFTWAVDNYRERSLMARDGQPKASWSPYFYTGWKGYRLQAILLYNGHGNYTDKGLSIRFYVLNGRFDEYLEKFVSHQITVTVFHPIENGKKITKHMNTDELKFSIDMGTYDEIDKLLYENTLYYTVTVKAN